MGNPFLALVLRETNDKRVKNADYYNKRKKCIEKYLKFGSKLSVTKKYNRLFKKTPQPHPTKSSNF